MSTINKFPSGLRAAARGFSKSPSDTPRRPHTTSGVPGGAVAGIHPMASNQANTEIKSRGQALWGGKQECRWINTMEVVEEKSASAPLEGPPRKWPHDHACQPVDFLDRLPDRMEAIPK